MKVDNVKWYHFWNPQSGLPGGLILGILASTIAVVAMIIFL